MTGWVVKFYQNNRGDECVQEFIENQDASTYAKIVRLLGMLEKYGPDLGMPYSKYLGHGLFELRVRGKNEVRIFYIFHIENTIYLLHAFKKRTQKTPLKELKMAINRQKELTKI